MRNKPNTKNDEKFMSVLEAGMEKTNFDKNNNTEELLEKYLLMYLEIDTLDKLWGGAWSLFVAAIAHRMSTVANIKVPRETVKNVISQMSGRDNVFPDELVEPISLDSTELEECMLVATCVCKELVIPSPIEVYYLYDILDKETSPLDAGIAWLINSEKHVLDTNNPKALADMGRKIKKLNHERLGVKFDCDSIEEYYGILKRVGIRCALPCALPYTSNAINKSLEYENRYKPRLKHKGNERGRKEKSMKSPDKNLSRPKAARKRPVQKVDKSVDPDVNHHRSEYYGDGGGVSPGWSTGKVILGVTAAAAAATALWYSHDRLADKERAINLSDFKIPNLDF